MDEILNTLISGEKVLRREWQYAITQTRHIKLRRGLIDYGDKYKKVSRCILTLTSGAVKVPKVIETGKVGEYEFVICERVVSMREATNLDIERILLVLEGVKVPKLLGIGPMIEKPPFLVDYQEELDLIGFKERSKVDVIINKTNMNTPRYTLQHGDLRHRNIIIAEDGIYLVDLDNVGVYPYYFERFYMSSYLGIPISCTSIDDDLLKVVNILTCSKTINNVTSGNQSIIRSITKRISLILDSRTAGINIMT